MPFYDSASFHPDISIGYLLKVTNQRAVAGLDHVFAAEGLTGVQWQALLAIHFGWADTGAALARHLGHDKGAMTRLLDQMEAHGWLTRTRDADDRRCINLALTERGRGVAYRCRDHVVTCWNAWLVDWESDDIDGLIAVLQKLRATLDQAIGAA